VWRAKEAKSRRVKRWYVHLAVLATLSTSTSLAEDFKTINGKEYKDATVSRVTKIRCKMLLSFAN
jgi:hypothetical protein